MSKLESFIHTHTHTPHVGNTRRKKSTQTLQIYHFHRIPKAWEEDVCSLIFECAVFFSVALCKMKMF